MTNVAKPPAPRPYPAIPYGRVRFKGIRLEGALYIDKTRFLHGLENRRYVFFIRPRRFGKSCWISLLESYYGHHEAAAFDAVFQGTDIGRAATPNHSRHVVLRFNFSAFNNALETLERNFESYCRIMFAGALARNPDIFPQNIAARLCGEPTINDKLMALFDHCQQHGIPLCILIDEYDNFANTILAERGADAYHSFTHGGGFYRSFFATLKAGAEMDSVDRLFITGVSPVTMDDVTSGFNIGTNISLLPEFNELLGFTEAEVRGLLEMYRDLDVFNQDVDETLGLMREWYNGYRFAEDAENAVYNTDMVLFYLDHSLPNKRGPRRLIDVNVRIDYTKLRHLLLTEQRLNGNFDLLGEAAGGARIDCELAESFPLAALARRENFLSLMHCFGLLSIQGANGGVASLGVPNQTVRQLLYGHLRGRFPRRGRVPAGLRGARPADAPDGAAWRVAPVHRRPWAGGARAHRHPRLPARREGGANLSGGVPEHRRLLRPAHRSGAGQRLRGLGGGAADGAFSRNAQRVRDRTEVLGAGGAGRIADLGFERAGGEPTARLPGRRTLAAAAPRHRVHGFGAGVPRLGTGPRRRSAARLASDDHAPHSANARVAPRFGVLLEVRLARAANPVRVGKHGAVG